jgi:hypothetical protein
MSDLVEGNAIRLFLEAKGSAADIQQYFELSTAELWHENIKDFIRYWGSRGELEAWECGLMRSRHKKPPVG